MIFKNYRNRREIIKRELEIYRQEQLLKIDREVEDYKAKRNEEMRHLAIKCAEDAKAHEHNYHHGMELLGIDIARLEAKKENIEFAVKSHEKIIEHKNQEVERLSGILTTVINNIQNSKVKIQQ